MDNINEGQGGLLRQNGVRGRGRIEQPLLGRRPDLDEEDGQPQGRQGLQHQFEDLNFIRSYYRDLYMPWFPLFYERYFNVLERAAPVQRMNRPAYRMVASTAYMCDYMSLATVFCGFNWASSLCFSSSIQSHMSFVRTVVMLCSLIGCTLGKFFTDWKDAE